MSEARAMTSLQTHLPSLLLCHYRMKNQFIREGARVSSPKELCIDGVRADKTLQGEFS